MNNGTPNLSKKELLKMGAVLIDSNPEYGDLFEIKKKDEENQIFFLTKMAFDFNGFYGYTKDPYSVRVPPKIKTAEAAREWVDPLN